MTYVQAVVALFALMILPTAALANPLAHDAPKIEPPVSPVVIQPVPICDNKGNSFEPTFINVPQDFPAPPAPNARH